jgi:phosphopantothenoylcysteine decarboxylase/phosphopantothenate--cysteine ligase
MLEAVLEHIFGAAALIMAAAVADFRPLTVAEQKIKKADNPSEEVELELPLARTPDILMGVKMARVKSGYPQVVVGFAAESENLLINARGKLEHKGLDLLVANDITAQDAGFEVDTNRVIILDANGGQQALDLASKAHVSEKIIERVAQIL